MGIVVPFIVSNNDENSVTLLPKNIESNSDLKFDFKNFAKEFDILIIHQGILEKLLGSDKDEIGKFINELKDKIPFIVITSGRGSPSTLPEDGKLLAFSNIESFLLKTYPEKFLLEIGRAHV